jgi:hypothetical protein
MSDNPRLPQYFDPPEGANLNVAFREHLELLWDRWLPEATGPQFTGMAVVAVGLLSYGRLEMVDYILGQLPPEPIQGGYCNSLAVRFTKVLLPLPDELRECGTWVTGSPEAESVRRWFAEHRPRLVWDPSAERFQLSSSRGATQDAEPLSRPALKAIRLE